MLNIVNLNTYQRRHFLTIFSPFQHFNFYVEITHSYDPFSMFSSNLKMIVDSVATINEFKHTQKKL